MQTSAVCFIFQYYFFAFFSEKQNEGAGANLFNDSSSSTEQNLAKLYSIISSFENHYILVFYHYFKGQIIGVDEVESNEEKAKQTNEVSTQIRSKLSLARTKSAVAVVENQQENTSRKTGHHIFP